MKNLCISRVCYDHTNLEYTSNKHESRGKQYFTNLSLTNLSGLQSRLSPMRFLHSSIDCSNFFLISSFSKSLDSTNTRSCLFRFIVKLDMSSSSIQLHVSLLLILLLTKRQLCALFLDSILFNDYGVLNKSEILYMMKKDGIK